MDSKGKQHEATADNAQAPDDPGPSIDAKFSELEMLARYCNCSSVIGRFRSFVAILMAVLALGITLPQPACAAGTSKLAKPCCCAEGSACAGQPTMPCKESCILKTPQAPDKQVSVRGEFAPSSGNGTFLFSIVPTEIKYFVSASLAFRSGASPSLFLANSPPQAALCLWRI
jgi:hypothetical protein